MKNNFYIFITMGFLTLFPSLGFATTWSISIYESKYTSHLLFGQTSSPTEYPVEYKGVGYHEVNGDRDFLTEDALIWIDHDEVTIKSTKESGASCVYTGKIDPQNKVTSNNSTNTNNPVGVQTDKRTASGTVTCSGYPNAMGWDAIVYVN